MFAVFITLYVLHFNSVKMHFLKHYSYTASCILLLCFLKFLCISPFQSPGKPSFSVKTPTNSCDFQRSHNSFQGFSLQRLIRRWALWIYFTEEWQGLAHYSTQIPVFEWEHLYAAIFWEKNVNKLQGSSDSIKSVEFGNRSNINCLITFSLLRWQGEHLMIGNCLALVLLTQICQQVALHWVYQDEPP